MPLTKLIIKIEFFETAKGVINKNTINSANK